MNRSIFRRVVAVAALAAATLASLPAQAAPFFSGLFVFGDSLSDNGNNAAAAGLYDPTQTVTGNSYVPSSTYAPARTYSNGPVWASYFASMLGVPLAPSVLGGTDYAFGGATTGTPGPGPGGFPFSLLAQVGGYLGAARGVASADALYVIAGGGNNARAALNAIGAAPASAPAVIAATAAAFASDVGTMVDALQLAGARHILVWNAPNLGLAPAVVASGGASLGSFLAGSMNAALAGRLAGEAGVTTFDLFGFGSAIAASPGSFGFTDVGNACGAVAGADCSRYAYWDGIHPTTAAHLALAGAVFTVAVPEPQTWALLGFGLGAVAWVARRRTAAPTA